MSQKDDKKQIVPPDYSEDEKEFRKDILCKMEKSRDQKNSSHIEFDGMNYKEYWETNAKAGNSYIPPKINKHDIRATTGTTAEKKHTLLSSLLNYNLQPDITAYDKNDMEIEELGSIMEDLVKKSRKIEEPEYELKRILIYNELLNQGDVFVEDLHVEFRVPNKELTKFGTKFSEMEWSEKLDKVYKRCETNLLIGLDVYLGNIREPYLENQPYVFTRKTYPRTEGQAKYGDWERWENVPEKIEKMLDDGTGSIRYNEWTLEPLEDGMMEEINFYDKWGNNWMKFLNGVMMFPVRRNKKGILHTFPLSTLTGKCDYPIAHIILQPIGKFAYGKSIPAKTKVDQQLMDEMVKAIVLKTRKSYAPPMANNTGVTLSSAVFYPGTMHSGFDPTKLQEIGQNNGVTQAEFNTTQLIKEIISDKSVSSVFEGNPTKGNQTAREILELKQQSMMKLGLSIIAVMQLEKKLSRLRLYNIIKYWTEPVNTEAKRVRDELIDIGKKYRTVTIDTEFEDGAKGQRHVEFVENEGMMPESEQVEAEEQLLSMRRNKKIKKNYINSELLKTVDYNWYIEITPTENNSSALKLAQFEETIQKMMTIFAPIGKVPNIDYLAERWTILSGEDPDRVWKKEPVPGAAPEGAPPGGDPMQQMAAAQSAPIPNEMAAQMNPQQQSKPSLNTMLQGA